MSRRTERVASLIRNAVAQVLMTKLADPRVDPARTSITRVEVPEDLLTARIFVSVMGTEGEQNRAVQALRHAHGRIQDLMMNQISLRNTPLLDFVLDTQFKKTLATLNLITQAMEEIRRKDEAAAPAEGEEGEQDEDAEEDAPATGEEPAEDEPLEPTPPQGDKE